MIELDETFEPATAMASIKVVGIGGAGGNTVNSIVNSGSHGIECIVANTDAQALSLSKAHKTIHIGVKSTKGLGTGANPDLGKRAAEEDLDKLLESIGHADIVFLTGGMGGGTGSGALPVLAHALRERNILSIAIVTKPFVFEGKRRAAVAEKALDLLRKEVDTLIIIPNQKLLDVVEANVSMLDAFAKINDILSRSVKGISDIITKPGHINVDFADVRTIMKDMGLAVMGTGRASGTNRAQEATLDAITSPLLENMSIQGARGVLLNITGGKSLGLHEISQAASIIYEQADENATIILGSVIDEALTDEVTVTIIATGFSQNLSQTVAENKIVGSVLAVEKNEVSSHTKERTDAKKTTEEKKLHIPYETEKSSTVALDYETQRNDSQTDAKATQNEQTFFEQNGVDHHDLDTPAFLRKDRGLEK
jgi:cell division protein FtsZ